LIAYVKKYNLDTRQGFLAEEKIGTFGVAKYKINRYSIQWLLVRSQTRTLITFTYTRIAKTNNPVCCC
jgi:hypothetical protein